MTPITSIVKNGNGSWTFSWSDTPPPYRVVLNGREVARVRESSYTWQGQGHSTLPPPLEIAVENDPVLSEKFLPYTVLQWYGMPAASSYLVRLSKDGGAAWSTVTSVQETGRWAYTVLTPDLDDGTTYLFQVIAVDAVNNLSDPCPFHRTVMCPPTQPNVKVNYSSGNIVVSEP